MKVHSQMVLPHHACSLYCARRCESGNTACAPSSNRSIGYGAFLRFHHHRYPREMGAAEVSSFLIHLAIACQVSASTQNQA